MYEVEGAIGLLSSAMNSSGRMLVCIGHARAPDAGSLSSNLQGVAQPGRPGRSPWRTCLSCARGVGRSLSRGGVSWAKALPLLIGTTSTPSSTESGLPQRPTTGTGRRWRPASRPRGSGLVPAPSSSWRCPPSSGSIGSETRRTSTRASFSRRS